MPCIRNPIHNILNRRREDLKRSSETPFQDFQTTSFIIKNGTKPSAF
ncbi:MAG: hypothetical protein E6899_11005 [Neisseria sp.]|nr:hypothetical protein [Neisseria sp.]